MATPTPVLVLIFQVCTSPAHYAFVKATWEPRNIVLTWRKITTGTQPGPSNPLGNPSYPGSTSCDGPNYVDFLTLTYNHSFIQTYNFGYGGATIQDSIVDSGFGPTVQSFQDQVDHEFLHTYVNNTNVPWTASNSLFTIFFGINDVTNSFAPFASHNDSVNYELVKAYESIVDQVRLSHSIGVTLFWGHTPLG